MYRKTIARVLRAEGKKPPQRVAVEQNAFLSLQGDVMINVPAALTVGALK